MPFCANKVRNGPASADLDFSRLFYSQPRQPPCAWHVVTMPDHLFIYLTLFAEVLPFNGRSRPANYVV